MASNKVYVLALNPDGSLSDSWAFHASPSGRQAFKRVLRLVQRRARHALSSPSPLPIDGHAYRARSKRRHRISGHVRARADRARSRAHRDKVLLDPNLKGTMAHKFAELNLAFKNVGRWLK